MCIRDRIILSRHAIYKTEKHFSLHDIGLEDLYNLFLRIQEITGKTPIVLDSTDLLKNPCGMLQRLSELLGFTFSKSMLSWAPGLRKTDPAWSKTWYQALTKTHTFMPYVAKNEVLPAHLQAIHEVCLPFYNALYTHRIQQ